LWPATLAAPPEGWRNLRQIWLIRQTTTDREGAALGVEDRHFTTNALRKCLKPIHILEFVWWR
jgi:hypothetical protein